MLSRLTYEATNVNTNVSKYVYMQVYMWGGGCLVGLIQTMIIVNQVGAFLQSCGV